MDAPTRVAAHALAQECAPRAVARRPSAEALEPQRRAATRRRDDDVAVVDCTDWRCCGAVCPGPMEQGSSRQRRINFTVCVVLLLFAFIYWTVVFAAVRAVAAQHAATLSCDT